MAYEDFDAMIEDDSWLRDSPPRVPEPVAAKPHSKRSKALNIDELLKDHYKEKNLLLNKEAKRTKTFVPDSESEDDEFEQKTKAELEFETLVEYCEKQVRASGTTVELPKWGEKLFQNNDSENIATRLRPENPASRFFQPAKDKTVNGSEPNSEDTILELLGNGWLHSFHGIVDSDMLHWIFYTMVSTCKRHLEKSAFEFLCHVLQKENPDISWIPRYKAIMEIIEAYGYTGFTTSKKQIKQETLKIYKGPPHNIGSLLSLLTVIFKERHVHKIYTVEEVEKMVAVVSSFSLDRSLISFAMVIQQCLSCMLNSLTDDEWSASIDRIAVSITRDDRSAVNCLKLVHSLHSRDVRMNNLQSSVALRFLAKIGNEKVLSGSVWDLLSLFRQTDVKKTVDFTKLYFQMSIADALLWSSSKLKADRSALEGWLLFLKSCSFQISSTDWKPYATKVRNRASYLLQVYQSYYKGDDYDN